MAMAYIRLYYDQLESLTPYSDAEVGRLIRGLLQYAQDGTEPGFSGNERFIWPTLRGAVERDAEQYAQKCAALRENGKNGRRGKANGSEKNQMPPRKDKDKDNTNTPPTPSKGEERFETFWKAYPRKTAKGAARKVFSRMKVTDELLALMLEALEAQKQSLQWRRDGGQYIPHPATWLNQTRWEDENDEVPFEPEEQDLQQPPRFTTWEAMYG